MNSPGGDWSHYLCEERDAFWVYPYPVICIVLKADHYFDIF